MRVVLLFTVCSLTALLSLMLVRRQAQLRLQYQLVGMQRETPVDDRIGS